MHDVVAGGGVDEVREDVVARDEVRLREVEHDEVSIHTKLELAALCSRPCARAPQTVAIISAASAGDGGRVAGLALGHQRRGLDLLKEVEVVVGCDGVGAEGRRSCRPSPCPSHRHSRRRASDCSPGNARRRRAAWRAGAYPPRVSQTQCAATVRYVEEMMAVEQLRGRQPVSFDALRHARASFQTGVPACRAFH